MASKEHKRLAAADILELPAGGGAMFILSGVNNICADEHHTMVVFAQPRSRTPVAW